MRGNDAHPLHPPPTRVHPDEVNLGEGTYRFRHDPLPAPHRHLIGDHDQINGNPLDWARILDPCLEETLVAVRDPRGGPPSWFHATQRLRAETFTSPLAERDWSPDRPLTHRLLRHVPYVLILREADRVRHAFDLRFVEDPAQLAPVLREAGPAALPATGGYATAEALIPALCVQVPYTGDRFARSTRKRFRLRVPGNTGDATVEGTAARILTAHGYHVEAPRLLVALYRLLVAEVIAHWWKDPVRLEATGAVTHHPPGTNPLEATRRGLDAIASIREGHGPRDVKALGEAVIQNGVRPPSYRRYVNRLARLADAFGPDGLAGALEGVLRGHDALSADLVATHPGLPRPMLVEVKSTGDRLRPSQAQAALYHERDQRVAYRVMRVEHARPDRTTM